MTPTPHNGIERLKMMTLKPPVFADASLEEAKRAVFDDKMFGRNPKNDVMAYMNLRHLERIEREIIIENL